MKEDRVGGREGERETEEIYKEGKWGREWARKGA